MKLLDTEIDIAFCIISEEWNDGEIPSGNGSGDPVAENFEPDLLRFHAPQLYSHLWLNSNFHRNRFLFPLRPDPPGRVSVENHEANGREGGTEGVGVLGGIDEWGDGSIPEAGAWRGGGDGEGVVEEDELLVGVASVDEEWESGGEMWGGVACWGGEVEGGDFEGRDGEDGTVGAVDGSLGPATIAARTMMMVNQMQVRH